MLPLLAQSFAPEHLFVHWSLSDLFNVMQTHRGNYFDVHQYLTSNYGEESAEALVYTVRHGAQEAVNYFASIGNVPACKLLLEHESDAKQDLGPTLVAAASNGHYGVVQLLIEKSPEVEVDCCRRNCGCNAQLLTSHKSNICGHGLGTSSWHIAKGYAPMEPSAPWHETALVNAATYGHTRVVRLLLENEEAGNFSELAQNKLALQNSVSNGHYDTVRLLLDYGADPNDANIIAARQGHVQILRLLLDHGACIENDIALECAARHGHYAIAQLLIEYAESSEELEGNALEFAAREGHYAIVQLLLANRCTEPAASAQIGPLGRYPANLHVYALEAASEMGFIDIVRLLLSAGANAQAGCALELASGRGFIDIVRLFLSSGAEPRRSAQRSAWRSGHSEIVRLLQSYG